MANNYVLNFEDGKIDDYGTISYKNDEFTLKISNRDKIVITKDGFYIDKELVTDSELIYKKINKWIDKTLKTK